MIQPLLQNDAFLADVQAAADPASDAVNLWWLGQSGFLVQHRGRHLLFDPYLSDSLTRKYHGTDKPHVRMTERVVAPKKLGFVDVITSTHNHTDHLDAETIVPIARAAAALGRTAVSLVLPAANVEFATSRLREALPALVPIDVGQELRVNGFGFTAVPAAHPELTTDALGRSVYVGYIVRAGPVTIYHSGDTLVYGGMPTAIRSCGASGRHDDAGSASLSPVLRGEGRGEGWDHEMRDLHRSSSGPSPQPSPLSTGERGPEPAIDVAILPINGKVGNMNGAEAAQLAFDIGARVVIPCHYDLFEFNTASPDAQFVPECQRRGQPYRILRAGERWRANP